MSIECKDNCRSVVKDESTLIAHSQPSEAEMYMTHVSVPASLFPAPKHQCALCANCLPRQSVCYIGTKELNQARLSGKRVNKSMLNDNHGPIY